MGAQVWWDERVEKEGKVGGEIWESEEEDRGKREKKKNVANLSWKEKKSWNKRGERREEQT